jgi:hypothetical protein
MTFEAPSMRLRYGSGSEATEETRNELAAGRQGGYELPDFAEIARKYPAFAGATSVYVTGSIVLGWGHANSDLDLYVVTEEQITPDAGLESFVRHVSTADPVIRIVLGEFGAYRADIEVWRAVQIDEVIGRFSGSTPSQERPELDRTEQDLLYRLVSGRPLHGDQWWRQRRDAINESGYGLWLAENRKLTAETYLEDVGGLLVSNDLETAVLAAHEAFCGALEALLAVHGDYSINRKWLYRRLATYQVPDISTADAWAHVTMTGVQDDPRKWAEQTARLAQKLLLSVERKAV